MISASWFSEISYWVSLVETKYLLKFIYQKCFQTTLNILFLWKTGTFNFRKWQMKTSKQVGIPQDPIAVSWQSLERTWVPLCCTYNIVHIFAPNPYFSILKSHFSTPHHLLDGHTWNLIVLLLPFFSMDFLVWIITSLPLRKWLLLCFAGIGSLNPLKTCAWLQGSIWIPRTILDIFPAPWHGPVPPYALQMTAISSGVELFLPILFLASCILDLYWILLCLQPYK